MLLYFSEIKRFSWPDKLPDDFQLPEIENDIEKTCCSEEDIARCSFSDSSTVRMKVCNGWMYQVPGYMPIGNISIPGTNKSLSFQNGTADRCQHMTITDQLKAGIRFLHIKPADRASTGLQEKVIDEVSHFLETNPQECVFLGFEGNIRLDKDKFKKLWKAPSEQDTVINMGDVRGKVILLENIQHQEIQDPNTKVCITSGVNQNEEWLEMKDIRSYLKEQTDSYPNGLEAVFFSWLCYNNPSKGNLAEKSLNVNKKVHKLLQTMCSHQITCGVMVLNFPGLGLIHHILQRNIQWHQAILKLISQDKNVSIPVYCPSLEKT